MQASLNELSWSILQRNLDANTSLVVQVCVVTVLIPPSSSVISRTIKAAK